MRINVFGNGNKFTFPIRHSINHSSAIHLFKITIDPNDGAEFNMKLKENERILLFQRNRTLRKCEENSHSLQRNAQTLWHTLAHYNFPPRVKSYIIFPIFHLNLWNKWKTCTWKRKQTLISRRKVNEKK